MGVRPADGALPEVRQLQHEASDADHVALRGEAMDHARACIAARDGWTVETLGHNIESAFGMDLDADECDDIARQALATH